MSQKLNFRLFITYIILASVVLCLIGASFIFYIVRSPTQVRQIYTKLEVISNNIQSRIQEIEKPTNQQITQIARRLDNNFDARIIVLDKSRNILVDSRSETNPDLPFRFTHQRFVFTGNSIDQFRDLEGQIWIYTSKEILRDHILIVAAPRPTLRLSSLLRDEVLSPLFRAGFIALLISIILSITMSKWISKPLEQIAAQYSSYTTGLMDPIMVNGPIEVKELAQSLNSINNKLVNSQRSQKDLVANISHDLKTPLTSIQGFAQAILDGTANNSIQVENAAKVIHSEATRMHNLILELLELARLESGTAEINREPVEISELLTNLLKKFKPQLISKNIQLTHNIQPLPKIVGDPIRLDLVFSNILDNAIKFSPDNGTINISIAGNETSLDIKFRDEGPGIPEEDLEKIFERFYQSDKTRSGPDRGSGLGLSLSREIINIHGGKLLVTNNKGKQTDKNSKSQGCTFMISIPYSFSEDDLTNRKIRKPLE